MPININKPLSGLNKFFILLIPLLIISVFIALFTNVFITLIFSLLIALILNPFVDFFESKGINRSISILIIYVVIILLLIITFRIFIPDISQEATSIKTSYKEFELSDKLKDSEKWIEKNLPFLKRGDVSKELEISMKGTYSRFEEIVSSAVTTAILIILVPVITFFILRDRRKIKNGLISIVPNKYFEMMINILDKIEKQLSSYVRGWIFDALFVGTLTIVGLSILRINNAVVIGLIAGCGHLIPYAGPIVGGIPAILISVIQYGDFHMVIPIVVMFAIIYVLDNSLAQPYIFSKSADMNPITIIALLLFANELLGAFGMLIAIPVATILKVSARETINGFRNYKLGYY